MAPWWLNSGRATNQYDQWSGMQHLNNNHYSQQPSPASTREEQQFSQYIPPQTITRQPMVQQPAVQQPIGRGAFSQSQYRNDATTANTYFREDSNHGEGSRAAAESEAQVSTLKKVHFTHEVKKQLELLNETDARFKGNAEGWHIKWVQDYAAKHCPGATRANVRKAAHVGGTDPWEPEHATVSFKGPGEDGKGKHVYIRFAK